MFIVCARVWILGRCVYYKCSTNYAWCIGFPANKGVLSDWVGQIADEPSTYSG